MMKHGQLKSCALYGIEGVLVEIEVAILPGLPSFEIVGLGDSAVRESRNRVHAAIKNSGFDFPAARVTASYAPAWLRKEGTAFDLPLALAILIASGQIRQSRSQPPYCLFGELSLTGEIRGLPGVICRVAACVEQGLHNIMLPAVNILEADCLKEASCRGVKTLREAAGVLAGEGTCQDHTGETALSPTDSEPDRTCRDISSIMGQDKAVRAIQIAAAGWHPLLMLGSPGCGKTSLASAIPGIMPTLNDQEALLVTRIYSAAGQIRENQGLIRKRPFWAPHHSVTKAALLGGGSPPVPGLCSRAHLGVLFLDELTEYDPAILAVLRQPVEEQLVRLSRMRYSVQWPAGFLLIGAANPCRCGEYLEPAGSCHCTAEKVRQHLGRISGPLLDRMDLTVEMTRLNGDDLQRSVQRPETRQSGCIGRQIVTCWEIQYDRCRRFGLLPQLNGQVRSDNLAGLFGLNDAVLRFAARSAESLRMTARGYQKILRVARTLADLTGQEQVGIEQVAEALQYRFRLPV